MFSYSGGLFVCQLPPLKLLRRKFLPATCSCYRQRRKHVDELP